MTESDANQGVPKAPLLMKLSEVADVLRVDTKTVNRWANSGRLGKVVRTPGGHLRIWDTQVQRYLDGDDDTVRGGAS